MSINVDWLAGRASDASDKRCAHAKNVSDLCCTFYTVTQTTCWTAAQTIKQCMHYTPKKEHSLLTSSWRRMLSCAWSSDGRVWSIRRSIFSVDGSVSLWDMQSVRYRCWSKSANSWQCPHQKMVQLQLTSGVRSLAARNTAEWLMTYTDAHFCAIWLWKLISLGQCTLPAYTWFTASNCDIHLASGRPNH